MPTLPMKTRHSATMVQPNNTFSDFNPLDVLATAASLQIARIGDSNTENNGESTGCDDSSTAEDGGNDDNDSDTRRVIIKTVQSDNVTKSDVNKLNSNNNAQNSNTLVKKSDGDLFGVPAPVNGTRATGNEDVKKASIVKILEGSNTKVLTAQEGKSLLSLGKTTSAKVLMQEGKSVLAFPDGTKLVMPGKPVNKGVTVLKINKQQVNDHSYTFVCQLKNLRQDDDEGYNSRSSMDSEGEEHPAPSPGGTDSALGSPNPEATEMTVQTDVPSPCDSLGSLSPCLVTSPTSSKPAKIVIVKRDVPLKQELSNSSQIDDSKLMPSPSVEGGVNANRNVVLRTLLKQKPTLNVLSKPVTCKTGTVEADPTQDGGKGDKDIIMGTVEDSQQAETEVVQSSGDKENFKEEESSSNVIKTILTGNEDTVDVNILDECSAKNDQEAEQDSSGSELNLSTMAGEDSTPEKSQAPNNENSLGETVTKEPEVASISETQTKESEVVNDEGNDNTSDKIIDCVQTEVKENNQQETDTEMLDNEAIQNTSENNGTGSPVLPQCSQTEQANQTHQYIIQDDLPPKEKLEQESTIKSTVPDSSPADKDTSDESCGMLLQEQGETVHITNTEETDCVSVGSPEVMSDVVASPLSTLTPTPATSTVQLLVTPSPPKSKGAGLANLTNLLKVNNQQQSRMNTKMLQQSVGNGVVHVIPVSAVKALGTSAQVLPKTVQYIAALPSGGTKKNSGLVRVQPAGGNKLAQPSTIIVPATTVTGSGLQSRLLPVISTKQVEGLQTIKFTTPGDAASLTPRPASVTGGLLAGIRTPPPVATRSLTPVSPFIGGHTSGRTTPVNAIIKSTLHSAAEQCMSPSEKINLKISSNSITESSSSEMETSPMSAKETATTSIGTLGSLSMKNLEGVDDGAKNDKIPGLSRGEFIRIQGSSLRISSTGTEERSETPCSSLGSPEADISNVKSPNVSRPATPGLDAIEGSSRTGQTYRKVRQRKVRLGDGVPEPYISTYLSSTTELHPVVDHDYCKFTEFSGDIQRSIIATSECKTRIERKYGKKARATRVTKNAGGPAVVLERPGRPRKLDKIPKLLREKQARSKKGRYKRKEKEPVHAVKIAKTLYEGENEVLVPTSDDDSNASLQDSSQEIKIKKRMKKEKQEKKLRWRSDKTKNYVKITGSYQDEFVYFTSKNHRKAPRKFEGPLPDPSIIMGKSPKPPPVGGTVNVFDWYRDMAKTDKTQFGGISGSTTSGEMASPNSQNLQNTFSELSTGYNTSVPTSLPTNGSGSDLGPKSESEVVDLVCELSGLGGNETAGPTSELGTSDLDMSTFLNSIGEDALKMLESSVKTLGDSNSTESKPDVTPLHETSFDGFLANFNQETGASLSQESNPVCDLDEINDSDLLHSDIGNMNAFLGAETSQSSTVVQQNIVVSATDETNLTAVPPSVANPLFRPTSELLPTKPDKNELFVDMSQHETLGSDGTAPDLTVVSMYWNDLPGLLINSEQYVRLVDIHKQVLPAKDTGILKKRCQMMGLPIHNCSDLQRDFLMRYANAAKSKSTVIVSKESAKTLIGFYVDPRPRTRGDSHCSKEDLHSPTRRDVLEALSKGEADSCILLSSSVRDMDNLATPEPTAGIDDTGIHSGAKGRPRKRKLLASPPRTPHSPRRTIHVSPRIHLAHLSTEVKRSARLQHKRVRYDEMIMGNHPFSDESSVDSPQLSPVKSTPLRTDRHANIRHIKRQVLQARRSLHIPAVLRDYDDDDDSNVSSDHENKDITNVLKPIFSEEHEMKRLRLKARRYRLCTEERNKLKRLKDKVRRMHLEHRKRIKEKQRLVAAQKHRNAQMKSKKKLLETHLYTKKYNQEHCYAACPENFQKNKNGASENAARIIDEVVVKTENLDEDQVVSVSLDESNSTNVNVLDREAEDVNGNAITDMKSGQFVIGEIVVTEGKSNVNIEVTGDSVKLNGVKEESVEVKTEDVVVEEKVLLEIVHRDATRSNRGRCQDGILHLHLYTERDSNCINCVMCNELLSVRRFMKHMHPHNRVDELLEITLPQRLEMRQPGTASAVEKEQWEKFLKLQDEYNVAVEKQGRSRNRKSHEPKQGDESFEEAADITKHRKCPKNDITEKRTSRSPRVQLTKDNITIRNGQVSASKARPKDKLDGRTTGSKASPSKTVKGLQALQEKVAPPPVKLEMPPTVSTTELSPQDGNVRQSSRVRKRKQLHPCESYVFTSGRNLTAEGVPESKRIKLDTSTSGVKG